MMSPSFHRVLLFASVVLPLMGQPVSFTEKIYPILEKAGCRNCHNVEGVASPTRLHFPDEDAAIYSLLFHVDNVLGDARAAAEAVRFGLRMFPESADLKRLKAPR